MIDEGHEHDELCQLLDRLAPGMLPRNVFHAIARLMVTTTFVVVPLLRRQDRTFTLLPRRPADDLSYPSMLNTPGTVIRANDGSLPAIYERLVAAELPGASIKQGPVFVGPVYDQIVRGREVALVHWVELEDRTDPRHMIDVDHLPADVVPTDRARIALAAAHFLSSQGAQPRG